MPDEQITKKGPTRSNKRSPYPQRLRVLADRAEAAEIRSEWDEWDDDELSLTIYMPNGRSERRLYLWADDTPRLKLLAHIDLAKYTFLADYEAIACYDDNYIEAGLTSTGTVSALVDRVLKKLPEIKEIEPDGSTSSDRTKALKLTLEENGVPWKLELSSASDSFLGLCKSAGSIASRDRIITLKVMALPIERHDQAVRVLEQISDSLFFDLDVRYDVLIGLQRVIRPVRRQSLLPKSDEPVRFPRTNYLRDPLTLYWYARSARSMPLLQYLSYYQTLEYFFPLYAHADALRRLRNELRDPRFAIDNDSHLDRILSLAAGSKIGFGNEREQLKATIRGCLDSGQLEASLTATGKVREHFDGKQQIKGVRQIVFANRQMDLRDQVADRIYDLRCRIVHTKDEADKSPAGLLLPFSSEASLLGYDIELIRIAAQKVLVANSTSLRL